MLSRKKFRRILDLYIQGRVVELKGEPVWINALNPFEMDESRHDAMVARGRLVMALREHGSDELAKVKSTFFVDGRDVAVERLLEQKHTEAMLAAADLISNDPEWKERLEIANRQEEILAREKTDPERKLLDEINQDYLVETSRYVESDLADHRKAFEAMDEDTLTEEYIRFYIDRRGTDVAIAEHRMTELWFAVRCCEGVKDTEGAWNHDKCESHTLRVFENKADVRDLPEDLADLLANELYELNMTVREAKNSARQGSGSASSPLPSGAAESTPSTPDATPAVHLGTSPSPSPTP